MAAKIQFSINDVPMAIFARGDGKTQSIWHDDHVGLLDKRSLDLGDVPTGLLDPVTLNSPYQRFPATAFEPERFERCVGLSLIVQPMIPGRLGIAGGQKRTSWTPAQPVSIFKACEQLREAGATIEGVFWLEGGKFYVEGSLPSDAKWGADPHEVRYVAEGNYSGGGSDRIMVSIVRALCANTVGMAQYSAGSKNGSVLKLRHNANIETRWEIDVPELLSSYSASVATYHAQMQALNTTAVTAEQLTGFFQAIVGKEPSDDASTRAKSGYERKLAGLRDAWILERDNASKAGFSPDSARVAYEAVTNVLSHGTLVDGERKHVFNGGHSQASRSLALVGGKAAQSALTLALSL